MLRNRVYHFRKSVPSYLFKWNGLETCQTPLLGSVYMEVRDPR